MFNSPRNWKWMVPAALIAPCLVWWSKAWGEWGWGDWAILPAAIAIILLIAAVMNLILYAWDHAADNWATMVSIRNMTPEVRMFEAAKQMHPEAVKALLLHRRTVWRIKYVPLKDVVDWVMDEASYVHAGFVDFVLDHSNSIAMMPKRLLSEGSKQFDPEVIVTDYQQYDGLMELMRSKLMVTQAYGNQAPQWLPPWNVELVRHRFGLDGEGYGVQEEMSDALMAVVRAQQKAESGKLNGVKQLPEETPLLSNTMTSPHLEERKMGGKEPELTEEELKAIRVENERYEKMVG